MILTPGFILVVTIAESHTAGNYFRERDRIDRGRQRESGILGETGSPSKTSYVDGTLTNQEVVSTVHV